MEDIRAIKKALSNGVPLSSNKKISAYTGLDITRLKNIKLKYKHLLK